MSLISTLVYTYITADTDEKLLVSSLKYHSWVKQCNSLEKAEVEVSMQDIMFVFTFGSVDYFAFCTLVKCKNLLMNYHLCNYLNLIQ